MLKINGVRWDLPSKDIRSLQSSNGHRLGINPTNSQRKFPKPELNVKPKDILKSAIKNV